MSYLVNNPNKFCAVAFAVCWFRFLFSQAYWKSRSIIFNMWVLTQQRQSSESRRIFCSVYSVCVSWIKRKAWLYPIPSRSNLDRAQVAYFITSLQHQFLVSLRGNLAAGSVSQDAGFFVGLWLCPCNISGCLTFQWSLEIIVARNISQDGSASFPGCLVLHLQTHGNCTSHSATDTFSAFQGFSI